MEESPESRTTERDKKEEKNDHVLLLRAKCRTYRVVLSLVAVNIPHVSLNVSAALKMKELLASLF